MNQIHNLDEINYNESEFVRSWVENRMHFYEFNFKDDRYGHGRCWLMCDEKGSILNVVDLPTVNQELKGD